MSRGEAIAGDKELGGKKKDCGRKRKASKKLRASSQHTEEERDDSPSSCKKPR